MPYLIVFLTSLLFVYRYDIKKKEKFREKAYFILFILAVLVAGCRYVVGGDTVRYMRFWEYYPTFSEKPDLFSYVLFDPFWMLLNVCCKSVCDDFIFFQFVHALLLNGILFYGVFNRQVYFKEHKFTIVFFYFIYFYLYFNMEILRESLAVSFFLLSLPVFQKKKWLKYYLFAIIAFLFHSSAIVLFILPVFRYVPWSKFWIISIFVSMFVVFNYLEGILSIFMMNPVIAQKMELYGDASMNFNGKVFRTIIYFAIPMWVIYLNDKKMKKVSSDFSVFYMTYTFVVSVSVGNTAIGGRFVNYMMPLVIAYYTFVLYNLHLSRYFCQIRKTVLFLFLMIPCIYFNAKYFKDTSDILYKSKNSYRWFPYTDIFHQNDLKQKRIVSLRIDYVDDLSRSQDLGN